MQARIYGLLSLIAIALTVYLLFSIKERVSALNYQLNEIVKQINAERDTIHTLKAERAYLTSPERLRKLASNYLGLESIKINQMVKDPLIEEPKQDIFEIGINTASIIKPSAVKWRYKRSVNKYLQTVSHSGK